MRKNAGLRSRLGLAFSNSEPLHKARTPHAEHKTSADDFNHMISPRISAASIAFISSREMTRLQLGVQQTKLLTNFSRRCSINRPLHFGHCVDRYAMQNTSVSSSSTVGMPWKLRCMTGRLSLYRFSNFAFSRSYSALSRKRFSFSTCFR